MHIAPLNPSLSCTHFWKGDVRLGVLGLCEGALSHSNDMSLAFIFHSCLPPDGQPRVPRSALSSHASLASPTNSPSSVHFPINAKHSEHMHASPVAGSSLPPRSGRPLSLALNSPTVLPVLPTRDNASRIEVTVLAGLSMPSDFSSDRNPFDPHDSTCLGVHFCFNSLLCFEAFSISHLSMRFDEGVCAR